MKSKLLNKNIIKTIALLISIIIVCSLFAIIPMNTSAQLAGGNWDYKAYGINKNDIYPQQSTWNWPITISETEGVASLKYNNPACNYAYTAAIAKIFPHNAHITLTVNDADRFFVMFGLKQQHYQLNSVSFKIDRANRSIAVYVGTTSKAQNIITLNDVDAFDNTKIIDIKLSKVSTGYSFKFNDYEYILTTDNFNQYNSYLRGCFDRNDTNIWFNVAPDQTTPKFSFNSIHSGEQVCYDELAQNHNTDKMNLLFDTIYSIKNIDDQITLESKPSIDAARAAYDSLPESLKEYIHNYNDLLFAEDAYMAALKESVNIDSVLYPVELRNIGPSIFAGWENKVKFTEANEGVTVEFIEATVHNAGLNVSNPLGLDGLHIRFKNCEYVDQGEKFALLFHTKAQIDMTSAEKMLWMTFSVKSTEVIVKVYSKTNTTGTTLISTSQLTKSDMTNWDIKFVSKENGNYEVTINGSVSGIIPAEYISDAKNQGLNIDSLYVTLGYNNFGTPTSGSKLKVDCVSAHDKSSVCSDELYDEFGGDGVSALKKTIDAINAIELPVTADSGAAILAAETAYNELNKDLQKYVTNYDDLVTIKKMYNRIEKEAVNIDSLLYPVKRLNIGPSIFAGWENKVKFTEAQEGVTVEFTEATVHNAGLNVSNPLGLDGLHIRFKNCEYVGQGEKFALLFHTKAQIDMTSAEKMLWMTFSVKSTEVIVKVYSKTNTTGTTLISTSQLTKSDMTNWDIKFVSKENGNYEATINGSVSGIIPAEYISDAKNQGLNIDSLYVTLGYNNFGTPTSGSKLKVDCVSAHDKSSECSDELYDKYGKDDVLSLKDVLVAIKSIGFPITAESGTAINTAEVAYDALNKDLKKYVTNYEDVVIKRKMYDKLIGGYIDMDYAAYGIEKSNIGPNIFAGWEDKVSWYAAESGKGITIDLNNTTVHSVGLNVNKPVSLDGLHVTFAEGVYENRGSVFALIFHKMAQIDLTSNAKQLWMTFSLSDIGVKINILSSNKDSLNIINTSYITKSDFEKGWDIKIENQNDGSYLVTLNGAVTGTIPKDYIDDATSNGFDKNSFIVSLASNNFGNDAYHLKADFISIHDGKTNCYYQVSSDNVTKVNHCEKLIEDIGTVTPNSAEAIRAAKNSFDALGEYLQGIVKNGKILAAKIQQYDIILKDIKAADKVEELINGLPNITDDKSYDDLLKAYFEYLDLYPRARKYVENEEILLNAVKEYETTHKGVNLVNESMNRYTKGKTAHYLKELIMNFFS